MNEFTRGLLTALIPGLFISVVAAYCTSIWAIRQFRSQKWWELKAEAYSQIIARLVGLQYCLGQSYDLFVLHKELDARSRQELDEESLQAHKYLTKAAAAGAYIVSDDTAAALEELLRKLDKTHPDVVQQIDMHYGAVKQCVARIREYAKEDLHKH